MSDESAWEIVLGPRAAKKLKQLGRPDRERLETAIRNLPRGDIARLEVEGEDEYRLRVGDWRVRFLMEPAAHTIFITLIDSRGHVYKRR